MAMLPLLNPFMFPVGPYEIYQSGNYDAYQIYRGYTRQTGRVEMESVQPSEELEHDALKDPKPRRQLAIKNFLRRGVKSITSRIRNRTKAIKAWKSKDKVVLIPNAEESHDEASSVAIEIADIAESFHENVAEHIAGDIDNNNKAASADSRSIMSCKAQESLENKHEDPVPVFYPQFCSFSHFNLKSNVDKEQTSTFDTSDCSEETPSTTGTASRNNSQIDEATEPTSNSEDQTSDEADTSHCVSNVSDAEDASFNEESFAPDIGDETQEVNPIAICRDSMMSVDRMFGECVDSDESFESGDSNIPNRNGTEVELMFDMDLDDHTDSVQSYNSHRGLTRTKSANLRLRYEILENAPTGQIQYKQKMASPSAKHGHRYSWDSTVSNDTQDSGCGSADDTEITVPFSDDAFDEDEKKNGSLDSDEDMSEVNIGDILPTLSRNATSFSELSPLSYKTTTAFDCEKDETLDEVHLDTIQEEEKDEYELDLDELPESLLEQNEVRTISHEKRLPEYPEGLYMIAEEEEEDNEDFDKYLTRIVTGSSKPIFSPGEFGHEEYGEEHGQEEDGEVSDEEEGDGEFQFYNGCDTNKARYGQYLHDEAEVGRAQTRQAVLEKKEYRLSKCPWWLMSAPNVMGDCGGPLLMLTTPEGEIKYPQDVAYYSDGDDEE